MGKIYLSFLIMSPYDLMFDLKCRWLWPMIYGQGIIVQSITNGSHFYIQQFYIDLLLTFLIIILLEEIILICQKCFFCGPVTTFHRKVLLFYQLFAVIFEI